MIKSRYRRYTDVGSASNRKTEEAEENLTADRFLEILDRAFGIRLPDEYRRAIEEHMQSQNDEAKKAMDGLTA